MNQIFSKIEASFRAAMKGEETINRLIWRWGVIAYFIAYFVANKIVRISNLKSVDVAVSILMMIYFAWHIYVLKKCSPKKPKLTKEEEKVMRAERRRNFGKSLMRKLFLKESVTEWDPVFITIIIDLFCIANFLSYVTR